MLAMAHARIAHVLAILFLVRSFLPCQGGAASDDFSKKAGGATASVFLFLLPKVAEESAKAVGKVSTGASMASATTGSPMPYSPKNESKLAMAASLYNESKEAMACLYNETKQAVACLYNETMHAVAFLYNESKQAMAMACPPSCFRPNPVCGKDGVTYWCGLADAECAGAEVDHIGFCNFGSHNADGKGVLAVQSLLLVHMIWLMLAAFLVLFGVP